QAVVIGINSSSQLPGVYNGVITFAGQGAVKDSPQKVYVSLTILPQCALQASPGNLAFTGVSSQPAPAAKIISLNVTQNCTTPLQWSAVATTNSGGHWLNISPAGGTTPSYPSISVNATGLGPGIYGGSIFFRSTTGTQTLPITFFIGQPTTPILATTPATMGLVASLVNRSRLARRLQSPIQVGACSTGRQLLPPVLGAPGWQFLQPAV